MDEFIPLDAETKVTERPADHEAELRLWLRLLTCTTLIEGEPRLVRELSSFSLIIWNSRLEISYCCLESLKA